MDGGKGGAGWGRVDRCVRGFVLEIWEAEGAFRRQAIYWE